MQIPSPHQVCDIRTPERAWNLALGKAYPMGLTTVNSGEH